MVETDINFYLWKFGGSQAMYFHPIVTTIVTAQYFTRKTAASKSKFNIYHICVKIFP